MMGPVEFQARFLGRKLWARQQQMVRAVATKRNTSVKGCHGSGKTFAASGLVPYQLLKSPESIVLTIAPTLRQVKTFWNEIHDALLSMPVKLPEPTTTGLEISGKNYALGFSSSKGVNAQGFHGADVLIIEDEAIGIAPDLHDAIEGIRSSGDVRVLRMCNPTVPEGAPYDDFTKLRGSTECITISAFDTPNLAGLTMDQLLAMPDEQLDYAPFPMLTRRRWVKEMYHKWGPTNPRFLARVLGEFPTQATDAVFQLAWIEAASKPIDDEKFSTDLRANQRRLFVQVGLDIAGPGDDETSACARIGPYVLDQEAWPDPDPLDKVQAFLGRIHARLPGVPIIIMGDGVGIGWHFLRALARRNYDVRVFMAGHSALDPVMFANAKAEAYWRTRELMRGGEILGMRDEDCQAQLSDVRYRELPNGKIEIEHKEEARARGSSSPDRAESLVMAFHRIVPKEQTIHGPAMEQISPI